MKSRFVNILIGGEAGQGLQTIGYIFAKSLVRSGFSVHVTQTYESRVRGGRNTFAIRVGMEKVLASQDLIDILIALNGETVEPHREELSPTGFIIGNADLKRNGENWIGVPFKEFGREIYWNTASMGIAAGLLGLDKGIIAKTVRDVLGKERFGENLKVLEASYSWIEGRAYKWEKLPPISNPPRRQGLDRSRFKKVMEAYE